MANITWEKPNGREIVINDHPANVAYAESLGWKRIECDTEQGNEAEEGAEEEPEPKRRGRPRKTE